MALKPNPRPYLANGYPDYGNVAPDNRPLPTREQSVQALKALRSEPTSPDAMWHAQRIEFLDAAHKEMKCK